MNIRHSFIVGWLLLGLIGCSGSLFTQPTAVPTTIQQVPADLRISLERTACFGECPIYHVTIDATGKVTYQGKDFVKTVGQAEASISNEQLLTLINAFVASNYWNYKVSYEFAGPECNGMMSDMPDANTSITMNGTTKSVRHYYGCEGFAGEAELKALEALIDTTVNVKQWTD
ncbi:DUF6438 domain-containing protein [Herpetosiphon llansteffanensis]